MGAWGPEIWDNDDALDVKDAFEYKIEQGKSRQEALEEIQINRDYMNYPNCVLAVADLQITHLGKLSGPTRNVIIETIENLLKHDELCRWREPDKREAVLKKFLQHVTNRM